MGVNAIWDNAEKTILRQDFDGKWTWDEYFAASKRTQEMMGSVQHIVDVIANMKPGTIPMNGSALVYARDAMRVLPNRGKVAVVVNPFVAAMLKIFKNFDRELGRDTYPVESVEAARKLLAENRAKSGVG